MLANNIANTGTAGFKADREFNNLYQQELPIIENRWTDFTQGTLVATGNPLSLALSGSGFFALNTPNGVVYSRNGNLQISKANELATPDGYTLRNALDQGKPIRVDPLVGVDIDKQGVVRQAGQQLGQIEIRDLPTAAGDLTKLGSTYFSLVNSASPVVRPKTTEILQGQLEQSNVPIADAAVRLVSVMRQFEMLQRAMNIGSQMDKESIEQVARV